MQINIKGRQVKLQQETIKQMERRLLFSLSRFGHDINRVNVRLTDINGPKGGYDKECLIVVKLRKSGEVVVQGNGTDCSSALNHCADRISRAVDRELVRRREQPIRKMRRMKSVEDNIALHADDQQIGQDSH